jgi:hypothetical protein
MQSRTGLLAAGLAAVAMSGCASLTHPARGRGRVDVPATSSGRFACLLAHRLPATAVGTTGIQIGQLPAGPTIRFAPTSSVATAAQIENTEQGAEVIGSALLYPNQASDSELQTIENCLAQGVAG